MDRQGHVIAGQCIVNARWKLDSEALSSAYYTYLSFEKAWGVRSLSGLSHMTTPMNQHLGVYMVVLDGLTQSNDTWKVMYQMPSDDVAQFSFTSRVV